MRFGAIQAWLAGALAAVATIAGAAQAAPVARPHVTLELVAAETGVAPGGQVTVALRQVIEPGWHTYWRNPGDSGQATDLAWTLPPGWRAGDIAWPAPARQPTGPFMSYGYQGTVLLPATLTAPGDAPLGARIPVKAHASVLVCADACVPVEADLALCLPVVAKPAPDPRWAAPISDAQRDAPVDAGLSGRVERSSAGFTVTITGAALAGVDPDSAYFFPITPDLVDYPKPEAVSPAPGGLTIRLAAADGAASIAPRLDGVLEANGRAYVVTATSVRAAAPATAVSAPADADIGLAGAIAFAFVGGLILNLMPCVFPVLAMKAAAMAGHGQDRRDSRRQGAAFLAGVMATFLGLAGTLIALRAGGAAIGWGFQLQSPVVVALLALVMLAVALNLSGLFEIGGSLQGIGATAAMRGGWAGSFFTGALAVVVAAPCTAPFMAPALGWALTQPAAAALAVFAGLGLGFASPFTLAAFVPRLLARLPRPGAWMDGFRKAMAFPMYGAAGWLAWVLAVQSGSDALARLVAAAVALAFAAWLLGIAQRRQAEGGRPRALAALGGAALIGAVVLALPGAEAATGGSIQPYSPALLASAEAAGKPVFVDYTAAWCVTCQVNEKLAIASPAAQAAFARFGVVYLKADWTRRDSVIAADLQRYGRAGVPLYLVYGSHGGAPRILPQILTPDIVSRALADAARG